MKRAFPTKLILSLTMALIFCISFGYYDLDDDITNTGVSLQREFSSFGQGIEKIVFMISGDRNDPNNITMQLQGNTIVVDKAFTAGSPTNKMEGLVTDSTIVGGTDNKITTGTANSLAGGQGNKISGSNSVIMGGSGNVINANTGIIMGGQENKITNAKAIIFGSHNEVTGKVSQSTDLENVILGNHIKLTNEGSGENVLMGSGYEFQGEKSFVRSTSGNKLSGSKTVIIDSPNGMIIQTGEAHGSVLTMLGNFLLSSKGTGDIDTNETGAVKTITHCNCYNDGTQWYSVQNTAACNLLCDKKVAECGPDVNTCKSGDLVNKDQENIKGQFWGCEGTTGSTLITVQCVKCHEHFTGSIGTGGLDCKEETQTGTCDFKTSEGSQNGPTTITQTRSGNLQTWVPTTKAVYQNSNVDPQNGTTCSFTCSGGYYYKNVTDQCEVCPIGTWRGNGSTAKKCGNCEGNIDNGYWILNANTDKSKCSFECNTGYHANPTSNTKCPANTGSISYTLNGGNSGSLSPTGRTYDSRFNVSNPTRIGYTFDGWTINGLDSELYYYGGYTTTNPQDIQYTKATKFKNLTAQNNGSINFVAQWKECPAGSYCPGDNTQNKCPDGFTSNTGSTAKTNCRITCNKGTYLPGGQEICKECVAGYYCTGGTYYFNGLVYDGVSHHQGIAKCSDTLGSNYQYSATGATKAESCYMQVSWGHYKTSSAGNTQKSCAKGYWNNEHPSYYNSPDQCGECTPIDNMAAWTSSGTTANNCGFTCKANYHQDGNSCVGDTLTCVGSAPSSNVDKGPSNYTYAGSTKEWRSNDSGTLGACEWRCKDNYHQEGNSCVENNISCPEGQYLPGNSSTCTSCPSGSYCEGGTRPKNPSDQGKTACSSKKPANSTYWERQTNSNCQWSCNGGYKEWDLNMSTSDWGFTKICVSSSATSGAELDLNGRYNNSLTKPYGKPYGNTEGYGYCDLMLDGQLVGSQVLDFDTVLPYNTSYTFSCHSTRYNVSSTNHQGTIYSSPKTTDVYFTPNLCRRSTGGSQCGNILRSQGNGSPDGSSCSTYGAQGTRETPESSYNNKICFTCKEC